MFGKLSISGLTKLAAIVLGVIIFGNLNGILYMMFNLNAPLSPILLLASSSVILLANWHFGLKLSTGIRLYFLFLGSYLFFGLLSLLVNAEYLHPRTSPAFLIRTYIPSFIIISAFYFYTKLLVLSNNIKSGLLFLAVIMTLINLFTFFAPSIGLIDHFNYGRAQSLVGERGTGIFANPNETGVFANYSLVLYLTCFKLFKSYHLIFLMLAAFAVFSSAYSLSKSAIFATVLILIVYLFYFSIKSYRYSKKRTIATIAFYCVSFLLILNVNFTFEDFLGRLSTGQLKRVEDMVSISSGEISPETTSERSEIFIHGLERIKKYPIFGTGIGSYHRFIDGPNPGLGVHNTYLLILGESGIIPFLLFTVFICHTVYYGFFLKVKAMGFFIVGIVVVFTINICMTGHWFLDHRITNAFIGIVLYISSSNISE